MQNNLLLTLGLLLLATGLFGQQTVSGVITDSDGLPLIGATVLIKGTSRGTATDLDGNYSLQAAKTDTLQTSYTGYRSGIEPVGNRTTINFIMGSDVELLDKVVVIGYGSVNKRDLTGAVKSLSPTTEEASQFTTWQSLLRGKVAGVTVRQNGAEPGSPVSIRIRGSNSLRGDNEPLYVIDGIIVNSSTEDAADPLQGGSSYLSPQNGLTGLNPQDIESIEILKDASATAIYGSRGANGVILITTKQGTQGGLKINLNTFARVGTAANLTEVLNAQDYVSYQNDARAALDFNPRFYTYADGSIAAFEESAEFMEMNAADIDRLETVDWYDDVFETAISQTHRLNISGGSAESKFFVAGGYLNNKGVLPNASVETADILAKYDRTFNSKFSISTRASASFVTNRASKGTENLGGANNSIIRQISLSAPLLGYNENNLVDDFEEQLDGPRAWLTDYVDDSEEFRTLLSVSGDYVISDVFTYRLQVGGDYRTKERNVFYGIGLQRGLQANGEAGNSQLDRFRYNVDNTLMFKKKLGGGQKIGGTVGVVWDVTNLDQETFSANDFPDPSVGYEGINQGRAFTPRIFDSRDEQLLSFLGRLNYSYKSKYLATVSFRSDGTSKFAPDNRFSFFPAVALAWRISNEDFLSDQNLISDAKFRIGYGLTGSQAIRPYQTLARFGPTAVLLSDADGQGLDAIRALNLANQNLRWETTAQLNAGFDLGFKNDRYTATIDVYHKRTSDLLQQLAIAPSAGFETFTTNRGDLVNRGVELSLTANLIRGKFNWDVEGNIGFNRNEIQALGLPASQFGTINGAAFVGRNVSGGTFFKAPANIFIEGEAAGLFYGYQTNGIVGTAADLEVAPDVQGQQTVLGDVYYVDQNGDGNITEADLTIIGDPNPDFTYGFGTSMSYGPVSLSLLFTGVAGNDIANGNLARSGFARGLNDNIIPEAYFDAWTPDNPDALYPRFNYVNPGDFTDRFIEDGSFLRLSFVSLGYTFPQGTIKGITNASLFFSGQNLLLFTDYSGFDPEVDSFAFDPTRRGIDWGSFPNLRSFTLGLNVGF